MSCAGRLDAEKIEGLRALIPHSRVASPTHLRLDTPVVLCAAPQAVRQIAPSPCGRSRFKDRERWQAGFRWRRPMRCTDDTVIGFGSYISRWKRAGFLDRLPQLPIERRAVFTDKIETLAKLHS